MLGTTNNKALSSQANENKKNQDILASAGDASSGSLGGEVGESIKNLSIFANSTKFEN